jgi:hypothetical protein
MSSYTSSSQDLRPQVLTTKLDTSFCFTMPQGKQIARYLIKGQFADSLEIAHQKEVKAFKELHLVQDGIESRLISKVENLESIVKNNEQSIEFLNASIAYRDKKIKRAKWHKILLGAASVASSVAIILK